MDISQRGIDLIVEFEGVTRGKLPDGRYKAYLDTIAKPPVWTVYCGLTKGVNATTVITKEQGDAMFAKELAVKEDAIESSTKVHLNQNEFDALVSFAYNCGEGAYRKSIAPLLNSGKRNKVPEMLNRYCHAGGKVVNGLVRRRKAESALFLTPFADDTLTAEIEEPMPQRVDIAVTPTTTAVVEAAKESHSFWGAVVALFVTLTQYITDFWSWLFSTAKEVSTEATAAKDSLSGWDGLISYMGGNTKFIFASIVIGAIVMVLVRAVARRK